MSEPISAGAAGTAALWKFGLGAGLAVGSGILGGMIMAAFDPPATRKLLFAQGAAAGVGSLFFGPIAVRALDHYVDWIDLAHATAFEAIETVAPVYLLVGTMSWGVFAALAKLRVIVKERGAAAVAAKTGLDKPAV